MVEINKNFTYDQTWISTAKSSNWCFWRLLRNKLKNEINTTEWFWFYNLRLSSDGTETICTSVSISGSAHFMWVSADKHSLTQLPYFESHPLHEHEATMHECCDMSTVIIDFNLILFSWPRCLADRMISTVKTTWSIQRKKPLHIKIPSGAECTHHSVNAHTLTHEPGWSRCMRHVQNITLVKHNLWIRTIITAKI